MIVVKYKHESDENYFLHKMKKMKRYLDEVIDCVESKEGDYYEDDDYDEGEDIEPVKRGTSTNRDTATRKTRTPMMRSRYNY